MTSLRSQFQALLFLAVAAFTVATSVAAEPVPTDRLLPPNVHAYLTIPNAPELAKQFKESSAGELVADPAMAEFMKEVKRVWGEKSEELQEKIGLSLDDLLAIPAGESSIAVVQQPGKPLSVAALLNFGDRQKAVDTLLDKAEEALKEQEAKRTEVEADGATIIVHTMKAEESDDEDTKKPARKLAYFVRDTWLVAASEVSTLEAVLARWDGKHSQTFADNVYWKYVMERCHPTGGESTMAWFVSPLDLVRGAMNQAGKGTEAAMMMGFLPPLGLNGFKAAGGAVDLNTDDYDSVMRTLLYVEQPSSGVMNLFVFPPAELTPPKWVPATASAWYGMNWDVSGAYAAIEKTVDLFNGQGSFARIIDQMAANENGPKLHVKKDFIDLLSGRIDFYMPTPADDAKDEDGAAAGKFVMSFELKEPARMTGVLEKAAKVEAFPGKTRDFQGKTIYEVGRAPGIDAAQTMGYSVFEGKLLIASDVTLIEGVLRGDADRASLVDTAEYKKVAKTIPAKSSIVGFQRDDAQAKASFEALRKGEGDAFLDALDIDFSKLPEFDAIKKHFPASGSFVEPDKKGALFTTFTLKAK